MICRQPGFVETVGTKIIFGFRGWVRLSTVVVDSGAVNAAHVAVHLGKRGFGPILSSRLAICRWCFPVRFVLRFTNGGPFGVRFVNVPSDLEVEVPLIRRCSVSLVVGVLALLALQDNGVSGWLPRL